MQMQLREYQQEAIDSILEKFENGVNKQVIVLATGLGKTIIFSHLISQLIAKTGKKALIVAHRGELLDQAKDKLKRVDGNLKIETEKAILKAGQSADVIVASVPTLGRSGSKRILRFKPEDFCVVVIDEAHHSSADTYKNILKHFGLLKPQINQFGKKTDSNYDWNKNTLLLGVTATPSRNDNKGIDSIFDQVSYEYGIIPAIENGWLSRIKAYRINTNTDISNVGKTAGDFNLGELGEAVNNNDRNGLVVVAYKHLLPDKQALCFAVDVDHSQELARRFQEENIQADFVTGQTNPDRRKQILKDFSTKTLKVVVNCMVLTEGFDEPSIDAILMARPTQSGILFQQMIGRGTRVFEGKEHLTIVDFVDNTYRQNLKTTASLLGIPSPMDFKGRDILSIKEDVEKLLELAPLTDFSKLDIDKIKYAVEEVDLLSGLQVPNEISEFTSFDWHKFGEDSFRIGIGDHTELTIRQDVAGQYVLSEDKYDIITHKGTSQLLGKWGSAEQAIKSADYYIAKYHKDKVILVKENARWRKDPMTPAQVNLLNKLRINSTVIAQLNKGQASRLITRLLNSKRKDKDLTFAENPVQMSI